MKSFKAVFKTNNANEFAYVAQRIAEARRDFAADFPTATRKLKPTSPIADLALTVRTTNTLLNAGLVTIADVYHYGNEKLSKLLHVRGYKEINEMMDALYESIPD